MVLSLVGVALAVSMTGSFAQGKKPNILVILADDIGWHNPSIYHRGDVDYFSRNSGPSLVQIVVSETN
jgi:arylsulfatase A-like enzyme